MCLHLRPPPRRLARRKVSPGGVPRAQNDGAFALVHPLTDPVVSFFDLYISNSESAWRTESPAGRAELRQAGKNGGRGKRHGSGDGEPGRSPRDQPEAVMQHDGGAFACDHFPRGSRTVKTVSRASDRTPAVPP